MLMDNFLLFEPTTGTAVTSGAPSSNVIDLLNERDIGIGDDPAVKVLVLVLVAFATGSSSKLTTQFQGAVSSASGSGGTWSTYAETADLGAASLTAGTKIMNLSVPAVMPSTINMGFGTAALGMPRYLRLNFSIGTTSFSAGSITAGLVIDREENYAYPPGVAVLN